MFVHWYLKGASQHEDFWIFSNFIYFFGEAGATQNALRKSSVTKLVESWTVDFIF